MHSGSPSSPPTKSMGLVTSIGIASLILEGRSHDSDDDADGTTSDDHRPCSPPAVSSAFGGASTAHHHHHPKLSLANHNTNPPVPCGLDVANQTQLSSSSTDVVYHMAHIQPSCSRPSTSAAAAHGDDTVQRLRQKLMLIRSAPGTSRDAIQLSIAEPSEFGARYDASIDSDDDLDMVFSSPSPFVAAHPQRDSGFINSLVTLATNTCLSTTPRSFGRIPDLVSIVDAWSASGFVSRTADVLPVGSSTPHATPSASPRDGEGSGTDATKSHAKRSTHNNNINHTTNNVGPHCEEFMKKIGLIKSAKDASSSTASMSTNTTPIRTKSSPAIVYVEEHVCSVTSKMCSIWKAKCTAMEWIYAINQPICIEVYLGPEHHAILLEQWIIERGERTNQMTMTLPSLCSAIRSQLYFSQISAWTEQLKSTKRPATDDNLRQNPRVKASAQLNILYRIRPFDQTSYFTDKPNTHNFPDTVVANGQVIKVCLKSLPRLTAIPTLQPHPLAAQPSVATATSSSGTLTTTMCDRLPHAMCTEKGKHRCGSLEEDESSTDMETTSSSPPVVEGLLTHRNRQLEKYRRRLQKRDQRKKKEPNSVDEQQPIDAPVVEPKCINSIRPPLYAGFVYAPDMSSRSERQFSLTSIGTQTDDVDVAGDIFRANTALVDGETAVSAAFPNCDFCGIEMQYICWNCDNKLLLASTSPGRQEAYEDAPPLDKAILLMQSIQRTPSAKQVAMARSGVCRQQSKQSTPNSNNNFNNSSWRPFSDAVGATNHNLAAGIVDGEQPAATCDSLAGVDLSDCRLCKRQKTKHDYFGSGSSNLNNNNHSLSSIHNNNNNNFNQGVSFNCPSSSSSASVFRAADDAVECKMNEDRQLVDEASATDRTAANYHRRTMSESLDAGNSVHSEHNADLACRSANHRHETVLTEMELKMYRRAYSEDVLALGCDERVKSRRDMTNDFYVNHNPMELSVDTAITAATVANAPITCSPSSSLSAMSLDGMYKKPRPPSDSKPIPKVNLSRVFGLASQPPFDSSFSLDTLSPSLGGSATSIGLVMAAATTDFIPMHKSNSAPSFQAANLLSPRFLKQAAIQKRRSRHLSDRSSERSSIGSDEQFSDEELGGGLDNTCIAMFSPMVNGAAQRDGLVRKVFPKSYPFGKKALLGSIEESLLQRRFVPKSHVPGFKVLLGASGGFCPTQLTIPSATSFYEMHGESLNTPYMCEIRMPRKGYSIPRKGTVQATLLNPLGMVVRMFVVPYDFRDMPALHQTFIRQRVLSSDNRGECDATQLSTAEQMKLLRYAIHLRFQTSRSGRLALHTDVRMLISRRTDCDTAAAHTKGVLESPNELRTVTVAPDSPKYSVRVDKN